MTRKHWGIALTVLATVALLVVVILTIRNSDDDTSTSAEPTSSEEAPAAPPAIPGQIIADKVGRQVLVPNNLDGEPLSTTTDNGGSCQDVRSPAGIQIQKIHNRFVLFSTDSGPTKIVNGVPSGYADGPRGAILAGINTLELIYGGGDITREVMLNHMVLPAERRAEVMATTAPPASDRENNVPAAIAFKIASCSDRGVVVQFAVPMPTDNTGDRSQSAWLGRSQLVVKDGGEWKVASSEGAFEDLGEITDKTGWTRWTT